MKKLKLLMLSILPLMANNATIEQKLYLNLDNKEFELYTNKANTIKIDNKEYKATVKLAPLSTFNHPNIKFNFPSSLNFSYDPTDEAQGLKSWSLNGDNLIIMVLDYNKKYSKDIIMDTIFGQYKQMKANLKEEPATLTLKNGKKLEGKKVIVKLGNITLYQELYILYPKTGTLVLMIQDSLSSDNKHTQEFNNALETLKNSINLQDVEGV